MKVCFVANFYKTFLFEKIAKELERFGHEIFWISFDKSMTLHLKKSFSKVLVLSKSIIDKNNAPIGDFKLNELVYGDRFLRYQAEWAYDYLNNIQLPYKNFIEQNGIRFIFGEITHAHEILLHRLTNHLFSDKVSYLHPQSVRIPDKRFWFLSDEFQYGVYREEEITNLNWQKELTPIVAKKPRRVNQVDKEVLRQKSSREKILRIRRFFSQKNIQEDMPSVVHNRYKRAVLAINEETNKLSYNLVKRASIVDLTDKKFVLYTLHMQPEASVDVVGAYYDDQLQNIKNIWRILPSDYFIAVKEHTNAIGNRSYTFFQKVKELRNAIIVDENIDSHQLIDRSQAIFTVSGTIAYEAALKNKPAFTFADIFFNRLKNCLKIGVDDMRQISNFEALLEKLQKENADKLTIEEFSRFLYQRSFKGIVDPPLNSEDWNDVSNIITTANSFNKFLSNFE